MKLKAATIKDLNITWWMARKPYLAHSSYDVFYLDICRNVFEILDRITNRYRALRPVPDRRLVMELAYTATAYFEDRVNGHGLWDACSELIREAIGAPSPFLTEAEYRGRSRGELNPGDLQLLFFGAMLDWHPETGAIPRAYPYADEYLLDIVREISDYFDSIDEVEESDFFVRWLDLRTLSFTDMKARILWLALSGYVFCGTLRSRVAADMELVSERAALNNLDTGTLSTALYAAQDQRSFSTPSGLLGIYAVDVLAEAATVTDEQKEQLRAMKLRPHGNFRVSGGSDTATFEHTITGDRFVVDMSGLQMRLPLETTELYNCTLTKWGDFWYVSGVCLGVEKADVDRSDEDRQQVFCAYSEDYRSRLLKLAAGHHEAAISFFGAQFLLFENREQVQERLDAFGAWLQKRDAPVDQVPPFPPMNVLGQLPARTPVAIFLPALDTPEIGAGYAEITRLLSLADPNLLSESDLDFLAEAIVDQSVSLDFWRYCYSRYGGCVLKYAVVAPIGSEADFETVLRLYRPDGFTAGHMPRLSLTDFPDRKQE